MENKKHDDQFGVFDLFLLGLLRDAWRESAAEFYVHFERYTLLHWLEEQVRGADQEGDSSRANAFRQVREKVEEMLKTDSAHRRREIRKFAERAAHFGEENKPEATARAEPSSQRLHNLLITIGVLCLALAERGGQRFKRGEEINRSAVQRVIEGIIDSYNFQEYGQRKSAVSARIREALHAVANDKEAIVKALRSGWDE